MVHLTEKEPSSVPEEALLELVPLDEVAIATVSTRVSKIVYVAGSGVARHRFSVGHVEHVKPDNGGLGSCVVGAIKSCVEGHEARALRVVAVGENLDAPPASAAGITASDAESTRCHTFTVGEDLTDTSQTYL
jgi:hypothetical protein